eukprot:TRINITY_DN3709_c0_g1_i3.p1 TRINITY_DN3709_c0_g1~~TRINITY_DN3709_c0_g1_i3.p1  ORF type:complete len:1210 (-),score=379.32 TRINITY_DN3709_c0_g1_i3:13-3642(-)
MIFDDFSVFFIIFFVFFAFLFDFSGFLCRFLTIFAKGERFLSGENPSTKKSTPERRVLLGASRQNSLNSSMEVPRSVTSPKNISTFNLFRSYPPPASNSPRASEPDNQYMTFSPQMEMVPFLAFDSPSNSPKESPTILQNPIQGLLSPLLSSSPPKSNSITHYLAPPTAFESDSGYENVGKKHSSRRKTLLSRKHSSLFNDTNIPYESIKLALTRDLIKEENFMKRFGIKRTPLVPEYLWLEREEGLLFPEAFAYGESKSIRHLHLEEMSLVHIPPDVFDIENLVELDVSCNQLIRVSPLIRLLSNLKTLNISNNRLRDLPPEIAKIKTLQNLCISFNPLPRELRAAYWKGKVKDQWTKQYQKKKEEERERFESIQRGEEATEQSSNQNASTRSLFEADKLRDLISSKTHFYYQPSQSLHVKYLPKIEGHKLSKMESEKLKVWEKDFNFVTIGMETKENNDKNQKEENENHSNQYSSTHFLEDVGAGRWTLRAVSINKIEKNLYLESLVVMSEVEHMNVNQIKGIIPFNSKNVKFSTNSKPNWIQKMEKSSEDSFLVFAGKSTNSSLKNLIFSGKNPLSLKRKMTLAHQVCQGMCLIHKRGFIHHNLKSSNVLMMEQIPKVSDYFLGNRMMRYFNEETTRINNRLTDPSSLKEENLNEENVEIPYWMAPEILENEAYDGQIDVYSFGMLLLEMLNEEVPFHELKSMEDLRTQVCLLGKMPKVKQQKPRIPLSIESLIEQCLKKNPRERPDFDAIDAIFESLIIEAALEDEVGADFWAHTVKTQYSMQWKEFSQHLYRYFRVSTNYVNMKSFEEAMKSILVDSDDMVNMENFIKLTQFYGPLKQNQDSLLSVYNLHQEPWFIGELSVIQTNDLMAEKGIGAYLVRYSSSEPGNYVLSVKDNDGSVKQYKIRHSPGSGYTVGETEYPDLPSLIAEKKMLYGLRAPAQRIDKYSDSNAWNIQEMGNDPNSFRQVPSLKKLCFRHIYLNAKDYQGLLEYLLPADVLEDYRIAIIEAATSDQVARNIWKNNYLNLDAVPFADFTACIASYLNQNLRPGSHRYNCFKAIIEDIADDKSYNVSIETFSKLLEWFGPLDAEFLLKITETVAEKWFHGNLSHTQAEKLISKHSKPGTFLVRFSGKNRGYFTLSVMTRSNVIGHYRIHYNRQDGLYFINKNAHRSLSALIQACSPTLSLRSPCPESKFSNLDDGIFNNG